MKSIEELHQESLIDVIYDGTSITQEWLDRHGIPNKIPIDDSSWIGIDERCEVSIYSAVGCGCGQNLDAWIRLPHVETRSHLKDLIPLLTGRKWDAKH